MADNNKCNFYEDERDVFNKIVAIATPILKTRGFGSGVMSLVLDFIRPYIYRANPYFLDKCYVRGIARRMEAGSRDPKSPLFGLPINCTDNIASFLMPRVVLTSPVPCAITTIAHIRNFNYVQSELIKNVKAEGNIISIGNTAGFVIKAGEKDPRDVPIRNKQGRPSKKPKNYLFGTANTAFRVKTPIIRGNEKVFTVKVFQNDVNLETLGGLYVDCSDTRDVNRTVLNELRRACDRPDLRLSGFRATMRNYKFKLKGDYNIRINRMEDIIDKMRREGNTNITCSVNIDRYPSAIIGIDVPNHTSKKKKLTIKIFQSSKINLDSVIYYDDHICVWYKFLNEFFLRFHNELLYTSSYESDYDSDYYYKLEGVNPPPRELV